MTDRKVSRMRNFAIVKKWQKTFDWFSFNSRSILDWFSFVLRSSFVLPSFILRSSFVKQSKIYRRTIEDLSKKQRKRNGATRVQLKSGNEHASVHERTGAFGNVECWMLSVELFSAEACDDEYSVLNYFTPLQFNIKHLTLNIGTMPLAMLSFEFWVLNCRQSRCWIVNFELRILNSQLSNSKCA